VGLKKNAEDGGTRRFILVQMEDISAKTISAKKVERQGQDSRGSQTGTLEHGHSHSESLP